MRHVVHARGRQALFAAVVAAAALAAAALIRSQTSEAAATAAVSSPRDVLGHRIGDDYFAATYAQLLGYWQTVAAQSPRVHLVSIGHTAEGRDQVMAIVTSPANASHLERYRAIAARLARARDLTDAEARTLAAEGKAIVWIDGGLHANELLGAQQLIELVYQLASRTDAETARILNDVIVLVVPANPDGMELASRWYMAHGDTNLPVLGEKYAGHDVNRDFYRGALPETRNLLRVLYREWYPQVVYDHHQTAPAGTVMFAPPFRDPFNYVLHPNVPASIDALGAAMAQRFIDDDKPGVTSRRGMTYSTWWNGGLRTSAYFHNMIGLLTETIGSPTPSAVPFDSNRQIPSSSLWWPIAPQAAWHFRQSVDYSMTANWAVLDYASRHREQLLQRIYEMGRDEIRWGSTDHWTTTPHELARAREAAGPGTPGADDRVRVLLRAPDRRDPRGFIIRGDQPDPGAAVTFVNALIASGVEVLEARAPFQVGGRTYPAHSFVVRAAQAFRPQVLDMFEPQDYPDDIPYPGAPPSPPYDNAGYTLAFQMGAVFDRIFEDFDGPFDPVSDRAQLPPGAVRDGGGTVAGYTFTHTATNSATMANRLLGAGDDVRWLDGGPEDRGTFEVTAGPGTRERLEQAAHDTGIDVRAVAALAAGPRWKLRTPRIGIYDQYGGSVPAGWTRLILEQFEFPYTTVYPPMLSAGHLAAEFDVLVFNGAGLGPSGGAPAGANAPANGGPGRGDTPAEPIPPEFLHRAGRVAAPAFEALRQFVSAGGTVVAIGAAARDAARLFHLPVTDRLAGLSRADFYVPGSILRLAVNPADPLAHGLGDGVDVFWNDDPVFTLLPGARARGTRAVAWFATANPLRSGWAWGAQHLQGGAAIVVSDVGRGHVVLASPAIVFRAQSYGTFTFLFNALFLAASSHTAG